MLDRGKIGCRALEAVNVAKRFGGIRALDGVSFDVRYGEIHALCGENGAGKSTLINVLSGLHPAGEFVGEVHLDGRPVEFRSIADSQRHGVAVIHQELALVDAMTVAENILLGEEPRHWGFIDAEALIARAKAVLRQLGVNIPADALVGGLGIGGKQLVEIAKAVSRRSQILILDEPTAALAEREAAALLGFLSQLRSQGLACIYISHRLEEVFGLADRITVLRDGRSVGTHGCGEIGRSDIIREMVGRDLRDLFPRREARLGMVRLRVSALTASATPNDDEPWLKEISFQVRAGEVLGVGGLMGAGRTELLKHLFGCWGYRRAGEVLLDGSALTGGPAAAIQAGLVYVSEDRRGEGLVIDGSVAFNVTLSALGRYCTGPFLNGDREEGEVERQIKALGIRTGGPAQAVGLLSGGNQQKVVLAKALLAEPKVLLLDEPTRGVDVGAKHEIYELINRLTEQGLAVVMVSSEMPELLGMSDRLIVLHEGKVTAEFRRGQATQEQVLSAAMGENQ